MELTREKKQKIKHKHERNKIKKKEIETVGVMSVDQTLMEGLPKVLKMAKDKPFQRWI